MAKVILKNINKIYDNNVQAVFDFNLEIKDKEFIVFVGPSGCGKTTTLRMIAGLEDITSGELFIDDVLSNDVTPKDRDIAMVFQSYALYPHMSVYDNMAFGLKIRHLPKQEIDERVHRAARKLEIEQFLNRKPKQLSGGQRQRVALGRAIVRNPKVFLMDEPLSNLDAKLRVQMRSEIIKLHESLGATTIYVTHDQTEAMTMATKIVVMRGGYIQQIGAPIDIYNHPANLFVASFIGSPPMNLMDCKIRNGKLDFGKGVVVPVPKAFAKKVESLEGKEVVFGIRPEDVHGGIEFFEKEFPEATFPATIKVAELLGHEYILHSDFAGNNLIAKVPAQENRLYRIGDVVKISMNLNKMHLFDKSENGVAIF
jgi:multiple sugar transport system ATP-binding protein